MSHLLLKKCVQTHSLVRYDDDDDDDQDGVIDVPNATTTIGGRAKTEEYALGCCPPKVRTTS